MSNNKSINNGSTDGNADLLKILETQLEARDLELAAVKNQLHEAIAVKEDLAYVLEEKDIEIATLKAQLEEKSVIVDKFKGLEQELISHELREKELNLAAQEKAKEKWLEDTRSLLRRINRL